MLGGGHINSDMQQFLENDKKAWGSERTFELREGLEIE